MAAVFALLCVVVVAHAGTPFRDDGDRESLLASLELARTGLQEDSARCRLLDEAIGRLAAGGSVDSVFAQRARSEPVDVLLTGYYEPVLPARRERSPRFRYPLFRAPGNDAHRRASRRDIDQGALSGAGLELFWLDDPVESFFLHVQGSGRLDLGNGETARVGYAANNGRSYHSIGKELVARGEFFAKQATAPAIKKWLREHRGRLFEILHTNPRYIFFREVDAPPERGPVGAMGVALVPFRSVATDPEVTPMGSVGFLTAPMPDGSILRRVVVAMDQGAAIRGRTRIDLFAGAGAPAELIAGELRARAQVVWLV
ncbi:MAG: MltA domain-containing protein [Candidatus Binatia bacterium]|nr:MltA domain-containing protein [Candidatus Binatia bacterium]